MIGREMFCLCCLKRLTSKTPPRILLCRHLVCTICATKSPKCKVCDSFGFLVSQQQDLRLMTIIPQVGDLFDRLEKETDPSSGNAATLVQQISSLANEILTSDLKFGDVPCKRGADCKIRTCIYAHLKGATAAKPMVSDPIEALYGDSNPPSIRSEFGHSLWESQGSYESLPQDFCKVCGLRVTMPFPFCMGCGHVDDIISGESFPDPLMTPDQRRI